MFNNTNGNTFSSFIRPVEYMMSASSSGRILFTSDQLIELFGLDFCGRNINEVFSEDVAASILRHYTDNTEISLDAAILGNLFAITAQREDNEINIFLKPLKADSSGDIFINSASQVCKEITSALSVLLPLHSMLKKNNSDKLILANMEKQLMRINRLSKNITDYSAYLAGQCYLNYETYIVNDFLKEFYVNVKDAISLLDASVSLSLPDEAISCCFDKEKIQRALLNIIANSLASKKEGINIHIILNPLISGNVSIIIKDNGAGCAPAQLSFIKERFYTGDIPLIDTYNNSGFGLAIMHAFLELHGGSSVVISNENQGTMVNITLPQNLDKTPPVFSTLISGYSGGYNEFKLELSQVLPSESFLS